MSIERGASQKESAAGIDELRGACNRSYDGLEIIKNYGKIKCKKISIMPETN